MTFATNNDLNKYAPDVFLQGVDDWTDDLVEAQNDVLSYVRVNYWNNNHSAHTFDHTLLNSAQWTKATVYRALSTYILPKLATFRLDDVFVEQIKFYKDRYNEELDLQFALGIEYDKDEDGVIQSDEVTPYSQGRLYR